MDVRRSTIGAVLAVGLVAAAGCGGVDEGENARQAAEKAVVRESRDLAGGSFAATPSYLEVKPGRSVIDQVRERGSGDVKRVTGVVRTSVEVEPAADREDLLRLVASGGEIEIRNRFSVRVRRDDDGWSVTPDGVALERVSDADPGPDELERGRQAGIAAIRALLSWNGDRKAYERAQEGRYATRLASEERFTSPGFDPPPELDLDSDVVAPVEDPQAEDDAAPPPEDDATDPEDGVPIGSAWIRTDDGGEDDVPLRAVLKADPNDIPCERFDLRTLRVRSISADVIAGGDDPKTIDVEYGERADGVTQTAYVTGEATVVAGVWESRTRLATCFGERVENDDEPLRVGAREVTVPFTVEVSRSLASQGQEWFVTTLRLGSEEAFDPIESSETVYSVDADE